MNIIYKRSLIFIIASLIIFSLFGCTGKDSGSNDDAGSNASAENHSDDKLKNDVSDFFKEMYACFNEKRFDDYLTYLNITDENVRTNMLNGFKNSTQYYETKSEIENLAVTQFENGVINVSIYLITTSVVLEDEDAVPTKLREIMYFNIEENGDTFSVKNFVAGGSELITE